MDKLARVCTACVLIPLAAVALGFLCDLIEFAPSRTPFGFGGTQLIRLFIIQDEDGFSFCRDCDGPHAGLISFHYGTTYERLRPLFPTRRFEERSLHIMLWGEIDEDYWDDPAADEWRPLIADFLEQGDFPEDAAAQVRLPALYEKRILWLGRFANGLLLSFPCALLLLLIKRDARTFRRGTRLRIGHCPVCDYDLRSGGGVEAGCPECGWSREDAEN